MDEYNGQGALQGDYVPKILSNGKWVTDPLRVPESPPSALCNRWLQILKEIEQELMKGGE